MVEADAVDEHIRMVMQQEKVKVFEEMKMGRAF